MPLPILQILPDQGGYQVKDGKEVLSVQLDGGMPRVRRDQLGAVAEVEVTYTTDGDGYDYVSAFFRADPIGAAKGANPFQCWLIFESKVPLLYTCYFIPGSMTRPTIEGDTYRFQFSLWVMPRDNNALLDAAIIAAYAPPSMIPNYYCPLDTHKSSCLAVYSTYQQLSSYAGPLVNVVRASDNTALDIYPDTTRFLNLTVLAAFLEGTTGKVAIWYDQTGLNGNATQATSANRPAISAAGIITFDGASTYFNLPDNNLPSGSEDWSIIAKLKNATREGFVGVVGWGTLSGDEAIYLFGYNANVYLSAPAAGYLQSDWTGGNDLVQISSHAAAQQIYVNGVLSTSDPSVIPVDIVPSAGYIGAYEAGSEWNGTMTTIAILSKALSAVEVEIIQGGPLGR